MPNDDSKLAAEAIWDLMFLSTATEKHQDWMPTILRTMGRCHVSKGDLYPRLRAALADGEKVIVPKALLDAYEAVAELAGEGHSGVPKCSLCDALTQLEAARKVT